MNAVMECPEGNAVCNIFGLPMMVKVSMSIIAAGRGTAKIVLRKLMMLIILPKI